MPGELQLSALLEQELQLLGSSKYVGLHSSPGSRAGGLESSGRVNSGEER